MTVRAVSKYFYLSRKDEAGRFGEKRKWHIGNVEASRAINNYLRSGTLRSFLRKVVDQFPTIFCRLLYAVETPRHMNDSHLREELC
jgi:hypothetical protein